ncbi:MAG: hypothetical protein E7539_05490 [Ruminococcaceae bacterium]|nr:hypothetical protein [Oscillospiraceae bacterium]
MRYFKYDKPLLDETIAFRKENNKILKAQKRRKTICRILNAAGNLLYFILLIVFSAVFCSWIWSIPSVSNVILNILVIALKILLTILAVFVSLLLSAIISMPLKNKAETYREKRYEILSKSCEYLRKFYKLQEPCLVTKCYESTDKRFTNHDVCVFVADDELRITTNLLHGFFHQRNDLGCYCFNREEVCVSKIEGEKFLIAELKAGNQTFLLGYRAKRFVEKNFIYNLEIYD